MSSARGEETKTRALDAALDLFRDEGASGFSIHAIVERSGVSLGSLYHHFGNVDGLSAALYARCLVRMLHAIGAALARTRTAKSGVETIVRAYLAFTRDHEVEARYVHASAYAAFLPAHAVTIGAAKADAIAPIVAFVRKHVEDGAIVALPEALLETLLVGPPAETARRWLAGAPDVDLAVAMKTLPARVWRSLATE